SKDLLRPARVRDVIDGALSLCAEKIKHNGVQMRLAPAQPELAISCRHVQISQIILNLVSNACDAIRDSDEKWIRIEWVEAGCDVLISVTDSGKGIPPEIREKIFQPFFTTKDIGKGTGLGLSISVGIARAHRGELTIDSSCANTR